MSTSPPPASELGPRTGRRDHRHRRRRRAGVGAAAVAACAVAGAIAAVVVTSTSATPSRPVAGRTTHPAAPSTTPTSATDPPTTAVPTTTDPGALPQTNAFPTSRSPQFQTGMAALWQGAVSDSAATARAAFFPETAYIQLKTIGSPASDFTGRLFADFSADLDAVHTLLGPGAAAASLVSVNVPEQYGHWIPPGVCDNRVGYFEVANSRVVYQQNGQVRSFGIASLISWRGEWYIVHLGAILRSTSQGIVENPESGPGSSPDSTTC